MIFWGVPFFLPLGVGVTWWSTPWLCWDIARSQTLYPISTMPLIKHWYIHGTYMTPSYRDISLQLCEWIWNTFTTNDKAMEEVAAPGPGLAIPKHPIKYYTSVFPRLMTPSHQDIRFLFSLGFPWPLAGWLGALRYSTLTITGAFCLTFTGSIVSSC